MLHIHCITPIVIVIIVVAVVAAAAAVSIHTPTQIIYISCITIYFDMTLSHFLWTGGLTCSASEQYCSGKLTYYMQYGYGFATMHLQTAYMTKRYLFLIKQYDDTTLLLF